MNIETIKTWRASRNLSQQNMADLLGVTLGAYAHWESGRRAIPGTVDRVMQVYRTLEIAAPALLEGLTQSTIDRAKKSRIAALEEKTLNEKSLSDKSTLFDKVD